MCPLTGRIFLKEKLVIFFGQFLSNFDLNGFLRGYLFFTSSPFNRFCSNLTEMCAMIMRNFFIFYFLVLRLRMRTITRLSSRMRNIAFIYSFMHAHYSVQYAQYRYPCCTYKCAYIAHA